MFESIVIHTRGVIISRQVGQQVSVSKQREEAGQFKQILEGNHGS